MVQRGVVEVSAWILDWCAEWLWTADAGVSRDEGGEDREVEEKVSWEMHAFLYIYILGGGGGLVAVVGELA